MPELNGLVTAWLTWEAFAAAIGLAIVAFCLWTLHARATARRKRFEENIQAYEAERSRQLAERGEFATASFRHAGRAKSRA